jgi:hypothetical protein
MRHGSDTTGRELRHPHKQPTTRSTTGTPHHPVNNSTQQRRRRNAPSKSSTARRRRRLTSNIAGVLVLGVFLILSNGIVVEKGVSPKLFANDNLIFSSYSNEEEQNRNNDDDDDDDDNGGDYEYSKSEMKHFYPSRDKLENNAILVPSKSAILQRMEEQDGSWFSLELSIRQQASFESNKNRLKEVFSAERLFPANLYEWGANLVTDRYAYIHIFKNGGTTMAAQTGRDHTHIQSPAVRKRKWFTLVRDPIEHFLSGWAECGDRQRKGRLKKMREANNATTGNDEQDEPIPQELLGDYDTRIQQWLEQVKTLARPRHAFVCEIHSFPQVNSFLHAFGRIPPRLELVGDLQELPAVLLKLIEFPYDPTIETGRNATANTFRQTYYPKRIDLLSQTTLRSLCDFLAVDYFLLDYDLPSACEDMDPSGYTTDWTTTTTTVDETTPTTTATYDSSSGARASLLARLQSRKHQTWKHNTERNRGHGAEDENPDSSVADIMARTDPLEIFRRMEQQGPALELSRRQQASFDAQRQRLQEVFPRVRRFPARLDRWGANMMTNRYAYIHIFKNGGTTIAAQTGRGHTKIDDPKVQQRQWFTVVRDPIDHFLSGWAECGKEIRKGRLKMKGNNPNQPFDPRGREAIPKDLQLDYDTRIQMWLRRVRAFSREEKGWKCEVHSLPQVNSVLNKQGMIPRNLEIVGDLKELPTVLGLIDFQYDATIETGRNATANVFLQTYYPRRVDLLSKKTIRRLCDFLAIDYFLLDYELPSECDDMGPSGYTNWTTPAVTPPKHAKRGGRNRISNLNNNNNRRPWRERLSLFH